MANPEKGEVSLDLGGTSYTLTLKTNALIALEDLFSLPRQQTLDEIFAAAARGSLRHIRGVMWAALREHHSEVTVEQVGRLIDKAGGIFGLSRQLKALGLSATPDPDDLKALGVNGKGNPRKAQARRRAGTGGSSISTRGASA